MDNNKIIYFSIDKHKESKKTREKKNFLFQLFAIIKMDDYY